MAYRRINGNGLAKLKQLEGFVGYAYDDADPSTPKKKVQPGDHIAGTLTIGYGATGKVKPGDTISEARATQRLISDLAPFEKAVAELVTVELTDNQFAALVIFAYNVGIGAFKGSTLLKLLNKGEYDCVPKELMKWVKTTVNGKKVPSKGLVNRRSAEVGLWASGEFAASASVPAEPVKKPIITKESVATTVMGAGGVATVADRLNIVELFNGSGPVQYALAGIIVISFAAAAYWFLKKRV